MTHVAWNCDGKKLAAVGIDKSPRIWSPEKSVRVLILLRWWVFYLVYRWSQELRPFSREDILMTSIISHGILLIPSSSVHRVKRTDGSFFGTHDVCLKRFSNPSYQSLIIAYLFRKSMHSTMSDEGITSTNKLFSRWAFPVVRLCRSPAFFHDT